MIDDAAIARGIRNQAAHCRHLALHSDGGQVEETDDYVFFAGAHDYPGSHINGAFRTSPRIGAHELLARADVFFGRLGRQYYLWTEERADADVDAVAAQRGAWQRPPAEGSPCVVRGEVLDPPGPTPDGYRIEVADTDEQRREYIDTIARNYDLGDASGALVESVLFTVDSLRTDDVLVLLSRSLETGTVDAATSAFLAHDCVGHEWTATDPSARGQGLGSIMWRHASVWGFDRGVKSAFAVASQKGISTWSKLGFDVPTHVRRYLVTPPALPSGGGSSVRERRARRSVR